MLLKRGLIINKILNNTKSIAYERFLQFNLNFTNLLIKNVHLKIKIPGI